MPMPEVLDNLVREFLNLIVIPLLGPEGIINLSYVFDLDITPHLYNRVFHDGTRFQDYDSRMFHERAECRLFTFGRNTARRLGMPRNPASSVWEFGKTSEGSAYSRSISPYEVPSIPERITRVSLSKSSIQAVTSKGQVYFTGCPAVEHGHGSGAVKQLDCPICAHLEGDRPLVSRLCIQENKSTNASHVFVDASEDAGIVFGVDSQGQLWGWDCRGSLEWGVAQTVTVNDWASREKVSAPIYRTSSDCISLRSGVMRPNIVGQSASSNVSGSYKLFPRTSKHVKDFVRYGDGIVILRTNGMVDISQAITSPDDSESVADLANLNELGPFVQISGDYGMIGLLTEQGRVVTADLIEDTINNRIIAEVNVVDGLQKVWVVAVAVGRVHYLALSEEGEVYSWGKEVGLNGCLGLGSLRRALKRGAKLESNARTSSLVLNRPTKIKLPGVAYGVFAGDDYSAVLVYPSNRRSGI